MKRKNVQIIKMIGKLGERYGQDGKRQTMEVNLLKWKDGRPVYDIRWWTEDEPLYGLSFTEKSLAELGELIAEVLADKEG